MALATRLSSLAATVYTLDGVTFLADLIDCEITINNSTEDAKGATDRWQYAIMTAASWEFSANLFADSAAGTTFAQYGTAATPRYAIAFTDGADTFTGTVVLTSIVKQYSRDSLTKYAITGTNWGAPTVAA